MGSDGFTRRDFLGKAAMAAAAASLALDESADSPPIGAE
jgi:hypothetical protein